jgi:MFS family permease
MSRLALYLAILAAFLNLFVQIPLTPVHARELTPLLWVVGLAVAAYSTANLAGNLFAGLLVDRFPRGPLIAGGLAAGGAALVAAGAGPRDPWWLVGCLAANGLALAVVTPAAFAGLLARDPGAGRTRDLARSGAAIGVAALVGPPVGGLLGDALGAPAAYQAAGLALVAVALLTAPFLDRGAREACEGEPGLPELWAVARARALRPAYVGAFTLMAVNGALVFVLPPAVRAMGAPAAMTGALFGAFALTALGVFLSPASAALARLGERRAIACGAAVVAAACLALASAASLPAMIAAMAVYGTGFGAVYLGAAGVLAREAPAALRGTATGVFYAVFSLGAALGPLALAQAGLGGPGALAIAALLPAALAARLAAAGRGRDRARA